MPLKVIVTGAYSTGKSTLVCALSRLLTARGLKVQVIPDAARSCPFPLNRDQAEDGTLWLAATQITREISAMSDKVDVVLCDRGIPDILAHHLDADLSFQQKRVDLIIPFLEDWLMSYDCVLRSTLNNSIEIVPDGLRSLEPEYRQKLAELAEVVTDKLNNLVVLSHAPELAVKTSLDAVLDAERRLTTMLEVEKGS